MWDYSLILNQSAFSNQNFLIPAKIIIGNGMGPVKLSKILLFEDEDSSTLQIDDITAAFFKANFWKH